jgi:prolipoprotein diacylglyceryltransferase
MLPSLVPAVVSLAFDPVVRVGEFAVRWETLGIAAALLVALVVAALAAGRVRVAPGASLRRDDLLFVALGATAGAVVGGRAGYVLLHLDYYRANPSSIADPASGAFELSLGVVGGVLAGLVVAGLLDGGPRRWAHVAAIPLVLCLGLGKAALALGGSGQGAPSDAAWATAYAGPGPWGSLAPSVASVPSQLYEAVGYGVVLALLGVLVARRGFRRRDGRLLGAALVLVAIVRAAVALTWRDAAVVGPVRAEQLLALAPLGLGIALWLAFGGEAVDDRRAAPGPVWPDASATQGWRAESDR